MNLHLRTRGCATHVRNCIVEAWLLYRRYRTRFNPPGAVREVVRDVRVGAFDP